MPEYIEREALKYTENATDEEIRAWMDAEIARLGDLFREFEITWHRNEFVFWVEIWSETKNPQLSLSAPHGRGLKVGEVCDRYGYDPIGILQKEGRRLYHRLKNDYPVHRDLRRA